MNEKQLTFEQLPAAVSQLFAKLEGIEQLISQSLQHSPVRPEKPLNVQEAAQELDLAVPTVYALVSRGELPHSKKGKRLRFDRQELLDWVTSGKKKTNAEIATEAANYTPSKKKGANRA